MKKTWTVALPITGVIYVEVAAATEEEAIAKALGAEFSDADIEQWEVCRKIVTGNVFNGLQNEATAEEN